MSFERTPASLAATHLRWAILNHLFLRASKAAQAWYVASF